MHLFPRLFVGLALAAIWPAARADDGNIGVNVVMDFTPLGKKLPPATAENPVYYLPLPVGYVEKGGFDFQWQRKLPPPEVIEHQVALMLAEQHYLLMTKANHPSLVLAIQWGYKKQLLGPKGYSFNDAEMEDLVGGHLVDAADAQGMLNARNKELNRMAHEPRWYLQITATDFQDWIKHKVTPLWRENVSTELWGHYMDQVLPTMITAAGPLIGRPMTAPTTVSLPVEIPPGWVTVGKAVPVK